MESHEKVINIIKERGIALGYFMSLYIVVSLCWWGRYHLPFLQMEKPMVSWSKSSVVIKKLEATLKSASKPCHFFPKTLTSFSS